MICSYAFLWNMKCDYAKLYTAKVISNSRIVKIYKEMGDWGGGCK